MDLYIFLTETWSLINGEIYENFDMKTKSSERREKYSRYRFMVSGSATENILGEAQIVGPSCGCLAPLC